MSLTVERIVDLEWSMLVQSAQLQGASVEGDKAIFSDMRSAQFSAWSEKAAESYLTDLNIAAADNRNLIIEKNIRALKYLAPEYYAEVENYLEPVSERKEALAIEISDMLIAEMEECYKKYPNVSTGQKLRSSEDTAEIMSFETHQKAEFLTYSEATLEALLEHVKELRAKGESLAEKILENTIRVYGFENLAAADRIIEEKKNEVFAEPDFSGRCGGGCSGGCCSDEDCGGGCDLR